MCDGRAAPAVVTSLSSDTAPATVPDVCTYSSAAISVPDGPAAPTGITSLSGDTAPGHRARCVHLQGCCHPHVRRASSPSMHNISFERYGAMLSCRICSPTAGLPSAFPTVQQHQQAQHLFRAIRRRAIVPAGFTYSSAAISMYDGQAAPAGITALASDTAPRFRDGGVDLQQCCQWRLRRAVLAYCSAAISVCDGQAAPAGLTSLSGDTGPCHRDGCVDL